MYMNYVFKEWQAKIKHMTDMFFLVGKTTSLRVAFVGTGSKLEGCSLT